MGNIVIRDLVRRGKHRQGSIDLTARLQRRQRRPLRAHDKPRERSQRGRSQVRQRRWRQPECRGSMLGQEEEEEEWDRHCPRLAVLPPSQQPTEFPHFTCLPFITSK